MPGQGNTEECVKLHCFARCKQLGLVAVDMSHIHGMSTSVVVMEFLSVIGCN